MSNLIVGYIKPEFYLQNISLKTQFSYLKCAFKMAPSGSKKKECSVFTLPPYGTFWFDGNNIPSNSKPKSFSWNIYL